MQANVEFKKRLPMMATYVRMILGFIIIGVLAWENALSGWIAAILFIIASVTDWLDGYWARIYQAESAMGKFMDPIADKLLVLTSLIMLLEMRRVDPYMVILLLSRDIFIGGLRSVAAADSMIIAAKPFGKWKTALQMIGIPCLMVNENWWGLSLGRVGLLALWLSVGLSLISAVQYSLAYYRARR